MHKSKIHVGQRVVVIPGPFSVKQGTDARTVGTDGEVGTVVRIHDTDQSEGRYSEKNQIIEIDLDSTITYERNVSPIGRYMPTTIKTREEQGYAEKVKTVIVPTRRVISTVEEYAAAETQNRVTAARHAEERDSARQQAEDRERRLNAVQDRLGLTEGGHFGGESYFDDKVYGDGSHRLSVNATTEQIIALLERLERAEQAAGITTTTEGK